MSHQPHVAAKLQTTSTGENTSHQMESHLGAAGNNQLVIGSRSPPTTTGTSKLQTTDANLVIDTWTTSVSIQLIVWKVCHLVGAYACIYKHF